MDPHDIEEVEVHDTGYQTVTVYFWLKDGTEVIKAMDCITARVMLNVYAGMYGWHAYWHHDYE